MNTESESEELARLHAVDVARHARTGENERILLMRIAKLERDLAHAKRRIENGYVEPRMQALCFKSLLELEQLHGVPANNQLKLYLTGILTNAAWKLTKKT